MMFIIQPIQQINLIAFLGLILDIIGVIILFFHAPPVGQQLSERTVDELRKWGVNSSMIFDTMDFNKRQRKDKLWSGRGLKIILVGFIVQLFSNVCAIYW